MAASTVNATDVLEGEDRTTIEQMIQDKFGIYPYADYTPTATIVTNLDNITTGVLFYFRVADIVNVSGRIGFDATTTGAVALRLSLPVVSDFTLERDLSGSFTRKAGDETGAVYADVTNDEALLNINTAYTASQDYVINFSYRIK